jgi:hypothetical protein
MKNKSLILLFLLPSILASCGKKTDAELVDAGATGGSSSQTFETTLALDTFTVPDNVTSITIEAWGAQGGGGTEGGNGFDGGLGARMKGTFVVTPGQVLTVLVGQKGFSPDGYRGGGGGGTFVTTGLTPLVVAGGGGGIGHATAGMDAVTSTSGTSMLDLNDGTGGRNGGGGGGGIAGSGAGGGGLIGDGGTGKGGDYGGFPGLGGDAVNGADATFSGNLTNLLIATGGTSFMYGGAGGVGSGGNGGFGGGGGAISWNAAGGGGGGFSGGGGGGYSSAHQPGGGGGSYNNGTYQSNSAGVKSGNGQVVFTW